MKTNEQLIADIYDGVLGDPPWQALLKNLRNILRADTVVLFLRAPSFHDRGLLLGEGVNRKFLERFRTTWFREPSLRFDGAKGAQTLDDLMPRETLIKTDYYKKFLKPAGTEFILGTALHIEAHSTSILTVSRGREAGNFGALEKDLINTLAPHLVRAIRLYLHNHTLRSERDVYASALDQLSIGVALLDQHGTLLCHNELAEQLCRNNHGINLVADETLVDRERTPELDQIIKRVLRRYRSSSREEIEALRLPPTADMPALDLLIKPIASAPVVAHTRTPAIALFMQNPGSRSRPNPDIIKSLFQLTRMEATVTALLSSGMTVEEAAAELGIQVSTVRAHLRSTFSKTGVNRQSTLVSEVLRSVAILDYPTPPNLWGQAS